MDFAERERIIRRYLDYVMAIEPDGTYRVADMREIARRAGMSEREIDEVERAAGIYHEHGAVHLRAERWDEAVEHLTIAATLAPSNVKTLFDLATAHAGRWRRDGDAGDRAEAERLIARCNELEPMHAPSERLLKSLDDPRERFARRETAQPPVPPRPNRTKGTSSSPLPYLGVILAVLGIGVLVIAIGIAFFIGSGNSKVDIRSAAEDERVIPVSIAPLAGYPDARVEIEESILDRSSTTYHVRGRIVFESDSARAANPERITVRTLSFNAQAIDSSGAVALSAPLNSYPCPDLSGSICFDYTTPYVVGLREIRLVGKGG